MAFTEIAVAVITTGPAYIAVWLTVRKAQEEPTTQPQACAQHTAVCEECGDRVSGSAPGDMKGWAFAA